MFNLQLNHLKQYSYFNCKISGIKNMENIQLKWGGLNSYYFFSQANRRYPCEFLSIESYKQQPYHYDHDYKFFKHKRTSTPWKHLSKPEYHYCIISVYNNYRLFCEKNWF